MKKLIFVLALVALVLLAGCSKTIDTGVTNCKAGSAAVGGLGSFAADATCKAKCGQESMSYEKWECSKTDHLMCICNQ